MRRTSSSSSLTQCDLVSQPSATGASVRHRTALPRTYHGHTGGPLPYLDMLTVTMHTKKINPPGRYITRPHAR